MDSLNKTDIKKHFNKSILSYQKHAMIQEAIAARLACMVNNLCGNKFNNIYEIGCGPGILTNKIVNSSTFNKYTVNDLVDNYTEQLKESFPFLNFQMGDAENINIPEQTDLIISGSTIQWFEDIAKFYDKVANNLKSGDYFAYSSFGPSNFLEIKQLTGVGLNYKSFSWHIEQLSNKFDIEWSDSEFFIKYFKSGIEVLKHIQKTGVGIGTNKRWNKTTLLEFNKNYNDNFKNHFGVSLSYQAYYFIVKKK
ncbi:MAG: methyltransferase domain-containing protein [Marinifilaceae bacterium]|jgi:malonyl-ACP O-methyltransferase BioC|nr:methyltransferase domain-containing protein [Marinifilaceae bacterium]